MNNAIFLLTDTPIPVERLQICTWDFHGDDGAIEIGFEFGSKEWYKEQRNLTEVHFILSLPFLSKEDKVICLEKTLVGENGANCKFIFNDTVKGTRTIKDQPANGSVVEFGQREPLAILPISNIQLEKGQCTFSVNNLDILNDDRFSGEMSVYVRLLIKTKLEKFVTIQKGIAKNIYLYDIKINEMRNLPDAINNYMNEGKCVCKEIKACFCMHVVPSEYNVSYADSEKLKNVRILESDAFNRYLPQLHASEDEYIILFHKDKLEKNQDSKPYSFFTEFEKERIGNKQIAFVVLANLACSLIIGFFPIKIAEGSGAWYSDISWGAVVALSLVLFMSIIFYRPLSRLKRWIMRKFVSH